MSRTIVYSGTYQRTNWINEEKSNIAFSAHPGIGIARSQFDPETGRFTLLGYTPAPDNPSVIAVSPDGNYLYAGNETKNFHGEMGVGGGVSAYRIDRATGDLTLINQVLACCSFPCGVVTDSTGKFVVVASHASYFTTTAFEKTEDGDYVPKVRCDVGSLSLFRVREDGGLYPACDVMQLARHGYDVLNQKSAHPHGLAITPDDYIIVPNKGGDSVELCRLDREKGVIERLHVCDTEYNSAPRHVALHPSKPYAFVVNEFNNKVGVYRIDRQRGELVEVQRVFNAPPQYVAKSYAAGDIQVTADGKFVYCTVSSYNAIVCYRFDEKTESLTLVASLDENMNYFREFGISPDGGYLIGADTRNERLVAYKIDPESGYLTAVPGGTPVIVPSCMRCLVLD